MTSLSTARKRAKKWLEDPFTRTSMLDEPAAKVSQIVDSEADPDDKMKAAFASACRKLAVWHHNKASVGLMENEETAWSDFASGFVAQFLYVGLLTGCWERDTRRTKQPRMTFINPSLCLANAIVMNANEQASWLGHRLHRSRDDGAYGSWNGQALPSLMVRLLKLHLAPKGEESGLGQDESILTGAYDPIFTEWASDGFGNAVLAACDYHVRMSADNDEILGEFAMPPYDVLPVEIWAVAATRARLGLPMPEVEHPVLWYPFEKLPKQGVSANSELLEKVYEKARGWF